MLYLDNDTRKYYKIEIPMLIQSQFNNESYFEFRGNFIQRFLNVTIAQPISMCDRIKFQIRELEK